MTELEVAAPFREELHEPGSEAWHRCRADGIGGSDVAVIMGRARWSSRFDLFYRKRYPDAYIGEDRENDYMRWGNRLEPIIRTEFRERHPDLTVGQAGSAIRRDAEWMRCNPDGWLWDGRAARGVPDAGLECKNADSRMRDGWGDATFQGVTQPYYDQCQWCMAVTGIPVWFVAVLFGGNDYQEMQVELDCAYASELVAECGRFWTDVIDGNVPDVDESAATYDTLKRLHPDVEPRDVTIPDQLADEYRVAVEVRQTSQRIEKLIKNRVLDAMGNAQRAIDSDGESVATRSVSERKGYTVKPTTVHKLTPSKAKGS